MKPLIDPLAAVDDHGDPAGLDGIVISPDGLALLAGAADGTVRTYDLASGSELEATRARHIEEVIDAAASADGRSLVTLGDDEHVRRWKLGASRPVASVIGSLPGAGAGIAADRDGRVAVSGADGSIRTYVSGNGGADAETVLSGQNARALSLGFGLDGDLLSGDDDGALRRWDPATGQKLVDRSGAHGSPIMGLDTSPDGSLVATVALDGTARIWDAERLSPRTPVLSTGSSGGGDVEFSPDGRQIVVASGRTVTIWSVAGGQIARFDAAEDVIWGLALDPAGEHLATASADRTVAVRSLDDPEIVEHRLGHAGVATDVVFSADGATLITTTRSGGIRLWDRSTGELLGEPLATSAAEIGELWRLASTPERSHIWFAGADGKVRESDLLDLTVACQLSQGIPDARQRARFLGGERTVACE